MLGDRPLIGITPDYNAVENMASIKSGYYEGIIESGGLPILIPIIEHEEILEAYIARLDGVLLSGGADVDARHYGESNMSYNGIIMPERDRMELYIAKKCLHINKPLLGICRGVQVMNVAAGGTIYQDIASQIKDDRLLKHSQSAPRWYPTHDVIVQKNTKIWECFKAERRGVNSFHHQAVKETATGFEVTARAVDGVIEGIESKEHTFAVGVQWHPECMWQKDRSFLALFGLFVEQCR